MLIRIWDLQIPYEVTQLLLVMQSCRTSTCRSHIGVHVEFIDRCVYVCVCIYICRVSTCWKVPSSGSTLLVLWLVQLWMSINLRWLSLLHDSSQTWKGADWVESHFPITQPGVNGPWTLTYLEIWHTCETFFTPLMNMETPVWVLYTLLIRPMYRNLLSWDINMV